MFYIGLFIFSSSNFLVSLLFSCYCFWNSMLNKCYSDLNSYQSTLKLLFQEFDSGPEAESQLAAVTTRIMQALQNNLDGKSKQYKDPALTHLFLMNNIHYMVRSVRRYVFIQVLYRVLFWPLAHLMIYCVSSDQKQKIYLAMTGFKGIAGLCSKMQISINALLGRRLVDQKIFNDCAYILLLCLLQNVRCANPFWLFLGNGTFCLDQRAVSLISLSASTPISGNTIWGHTYWIYHKSYRRV